MNHFGKAVISLLVLLSMLIVCGYVYIHSLMRIENRLEAKFAVFPNRYAYASKLLQRSFLYEPVTVVFRVSNRRFPLPNGLGFAYSQANLRQEEGKYIMEILFDDQLFSNLLTQPELLNTIVNEQFRNQAWLEVDDGSGKERQEYLRIVVR